MTRTTPIVNATVKIRPGHLTNSQDHAVVIALGDHGDVWLLFPDGTEDRFSMDAFDVVTLDELHSRALAEYTKPGPDGISLKLRRDSVRTWVSASGTWFLSECLEENELAYTKAVIRNELHTRALAIHLIVCAMNQPNGARMLGRLLDTADPGVLAHYGTTRQGLMDELHRQALTLV